jgi:hypothetical protein
MVEPGYIAGCDDHHVILQQRDLDHNYNYNHNHYHDGSPNPGWTGCFNGYQRS